MAEKIVAVLLLFALFIGGFFLTFNLIESRLGIDLGLGFNDITTPFSGVFIILLRLIVSPLLMGLSGFVIYNIIKEGL